jgi:hypothetical protein
MRIVRMVTIGAAFWALPAAALAQQSIAEWESEGIAMEKETGIPPLPLLSYVAFENYPEIFIFTQDWMPSGSWRRG